MSKTHTQCVGFTLAFPQAGVKVPIYLHAPHGIDFGEESRRNVLKLKKNLHRLKDAGKIVGKIFQLKEIGFHSTEIDQCVLTKEGMIVLIRADDRILMSKEKDKIIRTMESLRERHAIADEGKMEECLGIKLDHADDSIRMSQPLLIEGIIEAIPGAQKSNPANYPAFPSAVLTKDDKGEHRKEKLNYRSLMGVSNLLTNSSHPELAFATHQCTRFCNDPKRTHEQAIKRIAQ